MPYEVTSIREDYQHIAVVPRNRLAYTIIRNLAALKLKLADIQQIVKLSRLNPMMVISEDDFNKMVAQQAGLDMIYDSLILNDNSRIYYHTNWTVPQNNWHLMSEQLAKHHINITTIKGKDNPITFKNKIPV